MTHVGYPTLCDHWCILMFGVLLEEALGSSGDDEPNAGKQQQGAASLVQHGVEGLVLVLGAPKQETAACRGSRMVDSAHMHKTHQ